ncbi:hypothetical protein Tco_0902381 [Tanacetum coccineum]
MVIDGSRIMGLGDLGVHELEFLLENLICMLLLLVLINKGCWLYSSEPFYNRIDIKEHFSGARLLSSRICSDEVMLLVGPWSKKLILYLLENDVAIIWKIHGRTRVSISIVVDMPLIAKGQAHLEFSVHNTEQVSIAIVADMPLIAKGQAQLEFLVHNTKEVPVSRSLIAENKIKRRTSYNKGRRKTYFRGRIMQIRHSTYGRRIYNNEGRRDVRTFQPYAAISIFNLRPNMAFDLRLTKDVLPWPGNANMAFDLRATEDVLLWQGNANMAFDLRPTEDVLPWSGNANKEKDIDKIFLSN